MNKCTCILYSYILNMNYSCNTYIFIMLLNKYVYGCENDAHEWMLGCTVEVAQYKTFAGSQIRKRSHRLLYQ